MAVTENRKDLSTNEARQGVETGTVRWVLHISLALAVIAGIIVYFVVLR
jgi:hypothetical protein